jgi:O-antigen/teichoic acid export membrane protein
MSGISFAIRRGPIGAWLDRRPEVKRILRNVSWTVAFRGLQMVGALAVGVWVVRYLGAKEFGELNFAIAFVTLFGAIASLGLDGVLIRNIVDSPSTAPIQLGTAFTLKLFGSVVAALAASLVVLAVRPEPGVRWFVVIIAVGTIFSAFDTFDFWFQSQVDARSVAYVRGAAFLAVSAVKIVLVLLHASLWTFAAVTSAELVISGGAFIVAYEATGNSIRQLGWDSAIAVSLLRDSWPLLFSSVMVLVYMRIDQVMLGMMAGDREVGIYSVAVRLAEVWYFVPAALVATVFPSVVLARGVSEELFYNRLQKLYDSVSALCYAIAIPVTLVGPWVVRLLYGADYADAGTVLVALIWTLHFTGLGMARSAFLTTMNWTRVHLLTVGAGAALNIALNLWLIPRHGALGAAFASLVAYWFAAHGSCFIYPPLFKTGRMITRSLVLPRITQ